MFCVKCGNKLSEDAKFCVKCGSKIEKINNNTSKEILNLTNTKQDLIK